MPLLALGGMHNQKHICGYNYQKSIQWHVILGWVVRKASAWAKSRVGDSLLGRQQRGGGDFQKAGTAGDGPSRQQ